MLDNNEYNIENPKCPNKDCHELFNCCDCSEPDNGCGCHYCFSCNACEYCLNEE